MPRIKKRTEKKKNIYAVCEVKFKKNKVRFLDTESNEKWTFDLTDEKAVNPAMAKAIKGNKEHFQKVNVKVNISGDGKRLWSVKPQNFTAMVKFKGFSPRNEDVPYLLTANNSKDGSAWNFYFIELEVQPDQPFAGLTFSEKMNDKFCKVDGKYVGYSSDYGKHIERLWAFLQVAGVFEWVDEQKMPKDGNFLPKLEKKLKKVDQLFQVRVVNGWITNFIEVMTVPQTKQTSIAEIYGLDDEDETDDFD